MVNQPGLDGDDSMAKRKKNEEERKNAVLTGFSAVNFTSSIEIAKQNYPKLLAFLRFLGLPGALRLKKGMTVNY